MKMPPATLRGIAEQLNVHVSTVSRVLNGNLENVGRVASRETIARIRELAAQLNYQPNTHARTLKTRRSREIAIHEGIDEAASAHHYTAFVANTLDRPQRQRELAERALGRNVEGLLICDAHAGSENTYLEELAERQVPFVLVSRPRGSHCAITADDEQGGRLAAEHLFALGHRRVAMIAGAAYSNNALARTAGFVGYYREHGVEVAAERIIHGPFDTQAGFDIGTRLLQHPQLPTAIFAVNDFLAVGLIGAMRQRGLLPGRDIAVVGYNDTPLAEHLQIPLTSISTCMHSQGRLAVETLLRRIEGEPVQSHRFVPIMSVRASSQCVPRD
jgi:LacI family transcriptional regulator